MEFNWLFNDKERPRNCLPTLQLPLEFHCLGSNSYTATYKMCDAVKLQKCHCLGGLQTANLYFSQIWSWKSKIKMWAHLVPLEGPLPGS